MTDEENWRKAFEMIGPETLRLRLEHRRNEFSGPYARAAEIWLLEKAQASARIESARFSTIKRCHALFGLALLIASSVDSQGQYA
jgi:hypothetical protein